MSASDTAKSPLDVCSLSVPVNGGCENVCSRQTPACMCALLQPIVRHFCFLNVLRILSPSPVIRSLYLLKSRAHHDVPISSCNLLTQREKSSGSSEHESLSMCLDPQLIWEDLFQKQPSVSAGADVARGREGKGIDPMAAELRVQPSRPLICIALSATPKKKKKCRFQKCAVVSGIFQR